MDTQYINRHSFRSTYFKIVVGLICYFCKSMIGIAQLPVAHDLLITANSTSPADATFLVEGESDMFVGCIDKDFLQMEKIQHFQDGEVTLEVITLNTGEELILRLTNEANTTEFFSIRLDNNQAWLEENYNGQSRSTNLGSYQQGDVFKIIRCGTKILYHFKDMIIHAISLDAALANNFEMYGELEAITTAGSDFKALVNFHPL